MTKQITITTKTHNGGHTSTWTASEKEHVAHAQTEVARRDTELAGYSSHFGDFDDAEFPKFNDDGEQVSGATEATIADAIAWDAAVHAAYAAKAEKWGEILEFGISILEKREKLCH